VGHIPIRFIGISGTIAEKTLPELASILSHLMCVQGNSFTIHIIRYGVNDRAHIFIIESWQYYDEKEDIQETF
jgi:hypothetical protein